MPTTKFDSQYIQFPADTTANRPATPSNGETRYNTSTNRGEYYTPSGWLGYGDNKGTLSNPATNATQLYNSGVTQSGYYWIKGSGTTPYQIYCDMTTAGGKWMLLHQFPRNYVSTEATVGNHFTYSYNPSDTGPTNTNATRFHVPINIFSSNGTGSDLDVYSSVYVTSSWRRFGAYWRGLPMSTVFDVPANSTSGSYSVSGTSTSDNGTSFTSTGLSTMAYSSGWKGVTYNKGDGTYGYNDSSSATGGIIFHTTGPESDGIIGAIYGWVEGQGLVGGWSGWDYGRVWIRVQG